MIELIGGELFQWDTGRIVVINPGVDTAIHEVHFTTRDMEYAYVVKTYEKDGMILCAIPNVILQQRRSLICYAVTYSENGEMSVSETTFTIKKRNKPQDYAYTEDELKTFDRLESLIPTKLSQLEKDVELGVTDYNQLNNTPIKNVSSSDDNPILLNDLESGVYRLSGVFVPFSGSSDSLSFSSDCLVNIITNATGTYAQILYPVGNTVQFISIISDDTVDGGYTYKLKDIFLNDLSELVDVVGDLSSLTTTEKSNLVLAINEVKQGIVQPDWNQSDDTAADYIKNRPFYEGRGQKLLNSYYELSVSTQYDSTYYVVDLSESLSSPLSEPIYQPEPTYNITVEITYNYGTTTTYTNVPATTYYAGGGMYFLDYLGGTDGYPFKITLTKAYFTESGTYHLKIYQDDVDIIEPIPSKFLPDTVATTQYVESYVKQNKYTHPTYAARTGVPSSDQFTSYFGGNFYVSQPVCDSTGHITELNRRTISFPNTTATTNTDGLMSATDKSKLDNIDDGANNITIDSDLSDVSENPVQNKVLTAKFNDLVKLIPDVSDYQTATQVNALIDAKLGVIENGSY